LIEVPEEVKEEEELVVESIELTEEIKSKKDNCSV
jgi:hypothetical protein